MTSNKYAAMLFPFAESCVPENVLRVLLMNTGALLRDNDGSSIFEDRIQDLLSFLCSKVSTDERSSLVKYGFRLNGDVARNETQK